LCCYRRSNNKASLRSINSQDAEVNDIKSVVSLRHSKTMRAKAFTRILRVPQDDTPLMKTNMSWGITKQFN